MQEISLSQRARSQDSPIRQIFAKIPAINTERAELNLAPVIDLGIGQPHLPVNPVVIEALKIALEKNADAFGYSPAQGRDATLAAIVALLKHYHPKADYKKSEVMVTNGGSQALTNALAIFVEEGDTVLTPTPYFSAYESMVNGFGGELVCVPPEEGSFDLDLTQLENTLKKYPNTKAIILNYPNNPSGHSLSKEKLIALAKLLKQYPRVAILEDNVYRDLSDQPQLSLLDIDPSLKLRMVVISSGSKHLAGAPDMRIGIAAANESWIKAMTSWQLRCVSGVPYLTQVALIAAIQDRLKNPGSGWLEACKKEYQENIEFMFTGLKKLGLAPNLKPSGTFFMLIYAKSLLGKSIPDTVKIQGKDGALITISDVRKKIGATKFTTDQDIANYFLRIAGVAMVPGSGFGLPATAGHLRISCAKDKATLASALQRIETAISNVRSYQYKEDLRCAIYGMRHKFAPISQNATIMNRPHWDAPSSLLRSNL